MPYTGHRNRTCVCIVGIRRSRSMRRLPMLARAVSFRASKRHIFRGKRRRMVARMPVSPGPPMRICRAHSRLLSRSPPRITVRLAPSKHTCIKSDSCCRIFPNPPRFRFPKIRITTTSPTCGKIRPMVGCQARLLAEMLKKIRAVTIRIRAMDSPPSRNTVVSR